LSQQIMYGQQHKYYQFSATRNAIYDTLFVPWTGPMCIMLAAPVAARYAGAAAARAAKPYIHAAADWYRKWTYGGRGGFKPGELWY
jgi:hypothetical protein